MSFVFFTGFTFALMAKSHSKTADMPLAGRHQEDGTKLS